MMKDAYLAGNEIINNALAETNAEMNDKEYTEAKRGTRWKQKLNRKQRL